MEVRDLETILSEYEMVALIANSEGVDVEAVSRGLPERTLYIFFTGCAKVLARPFDKDAILCHRLVSGGTRFQKSKKHFDKAYALFSRPPRAEIGVLADRGVPEGTPGMTAPRRSALVPYTLDFDYVFGSLYPVGRMPTTGFAVALWLLERASHANVCLCGFTGVAGMQFNMHVEHDWTFEQIMLRCFVNRGRLRFFEEGVSGPAGTLERICRHFPELNESTIALIASNVLANRYTGMERQVARLWASTKLERRIRAFFKRFSR
ncbi:hypothetical protein [Ensifer aridi]|uniref:hypothetical protein n=1 Tax=Ensifer aridi TaxID=1708715 RepID=UPI0009BE23AC|nr:hypothetical protein [Ensifer aridi]